MLGKGKLSSESEATYKMYLTLDSCKIVGANALYPSNYGSTALCFWGNVDATINNCVFEDCESGIYSEYASYWWNVHLHNKLEMTNNKFVNCETCIEIDSIDGEEELLDGIEGLEAEGFETVILADLYDEMAGEGWEKDPELHISGGYRWYNWYKDGFNAHQVPVTWCYYDYQ